MRSIPDVAIDADPVQGLQICQADLGGCLSGRRFGGTSMAAPEWAAYAAALNAMLGSNLGNANLRLYPLANTNAFHSAASMGSDFAHVGLGSPDFLQLRLGLTGLTPGAASPSLSVAFAEDQRRRHRPRRRRHHRVGAGGPYRRQRVSSQRQEVYRSPRLPAAPRLLLPAP